MEALPTLGLLASDSALAVEKRLRAIAGQFEPALRGRVGRLLVAATEAIQKLADLDLVRHEDGGGASHSLVVWEELAPMMADTVTCTNALIAIAQDAFPPPPAGELLDNLDDAFGPSLGAKPPPEIAKSDEQEIAALVDAVSTGLRADVSRLGERLRTPSVMADPWHLIGDLLEFRGRLRAGIGELIFQISRRVDEVERAEVVPGFQADLANSVLVRAASTNLAFLFRGHARRIGSVEGTRIRAALVDALKDLGSFSRTRALLSLRTPDKRIFLETREKLRQLSRETPPRVQEIRDATENLARFLDSLTVISRRENLRLHDRAALAAAGRLLESANDALARSEPAPARAKLMEVVRAAWSLYGRDPQLDAWLRAHRHFPIDWLVDSELQAESERLGALLAGVSGV